MTRIRATKVEARRDFQKSAGDLPWSGAPQNLKFEREDWALFRTVEGLQQKAGVERGKLRRLALKELADNALDEGGKARVGILAVPAPPRVASRHGRPDDADAR